MELTTPRHTICESVSHSIKSILPLELLGATNNLPLATIL